MKQELIHQKKCHTNIKILFSEWLKAYLRNSKSKALQINVIAKNNGRKYMKIWHRAMVRMRKKSVKVAKCLKLFDQTVTHAKNGAMQKWRHWINCIKTKNLTEHNFNLRARQRMVFRFFNIWHIKYHKIVKSQYTKVKQEKEVLERKLQIKDFEKQSQNRSLQKISLQLDNTSNQFESITQKCTNQELLIKAQQSKIKQLHHAMQLIKAENQALNSKNDFAQIKQNDVEVLIAKQRRAFQQTIKKLRKELLISQAKTQQTQHQLKLIKEHKIESDQMVIQTVAKEEKNIQNYHSQLQRQTQNLSSLQLTVKAKNQEMSKLSRNMQLIRSENRQLREQLTLKTSLDKQNTNAISTTVDELNNMIDKQNIQKQRLHQELLIAHSQINKLTHQVKKEQYKFKYLSTSSTNNINTPDYHSIR